MNKFNRIISFICAFTILLSTISCLSFINVLAAGSDGVKYTFDESDTDYWSSVNPANGTFGIGSGGAAGNALSTKYKIYDNTLITFDFVLKNNTKYFISYQFKTNDWSATINSGTSKVVCAEEGKKSNKKNLASFETVGGWPDNMEKWNTRTTVFETGSDTVDGARNKLGFYMEFGKDGTFYIDNVIIYELKTYDNYSTDFENDYNNEIINYTYNDVEVVADPLNRQGNVLKLEKQNGKDGIYKLLFPVELVANGSYTLSYKYMTDASSVVGPDKSTVFNIVNESSYANEKLPERSKSKDKKIHDFAVRTEGEWPKLDVGTWISQSFDFNVSPTDVANGYKYVNLNIFVYKDVPDGKFSIYLDDIAITKNAIVKSEEKYSFNEGDSKPWSKIYTVSSGKVDQTTETEFDIKSGNLVGEFKANQYGIIVTDFLLEKNSKYILSYKFKTGGADQTLCAFSQVIAATEKETPLSENSTVKLSDFVPMSDADTYGYQKDHENWSKNTVIIDTTNKVLDKNRYLSLFVSLGTDGKIYFDDIEIAKLKSDEKSYYNDFSNGTSSGIINTNAASDVAITDTNSADYKDALTLKKYNNDGPTYTIFVPYQFVAGKSYAISYAYKSNASKKVSIDVESKLYLAPSAIYDHGKDGCYEAFDFGNVSGKFPELAVFSENYEGEDPVIPRKTWKNAEREVTIPKDDFNNGYQYLAIHIKLKADQPTTEAEWPLYIDNISIKEIIPEPISGDNVYTFEDTSDINDTFRTFALPETYNDSTTRVNTNGGVEVVEDGENNHSLKISSISYVWTVVNFNYLLESGEDYEISYKIKRGEKSAVLEQSGIYAAGDAVASTKTESFNLYKNQKASSKLLAESGDVTLKRLASLYNYSDLDAWNVDKGLGKEWIEYKTIISPDAVENDRKLLSLALMFDPGNETAITDIYIDDISIRKVDISTVKVYADKEVTFKTYEKDEIINLPLSEGKYGYDFEGIYADPDCLNLVSKDKIVWPDVDATYYEKWVKSSKSEKPIGDKKSWDFEAPSTSYSAYCFENKQDDKNIQRVTEGGDFVLKTNTPNDNAVLYNFDFKFESFTKYRITYTLRGENCKLYQDHDYGAGIYATKDLKNCNYVAGSGDFNSLIGDKLTYLYGSSSKNITKSTNTERYVREVETGYVNENNDTLSFLIRLKDAADNSALSLDDVKIEKIGVVNNSGDREIVSDFDAYNKAVCEGNSSAAVTEGPIVLISNKKNTVAVNFDYILRNNATYKISYDIKTASNLSVNNNLKIYVGNSFTDSKKTTVKSNVRGKELYSLKKELTSEYQHIEDIFIVGNNATIDDYKYLTMAFSSSSDTEEKVMIENLKIEKISTNTNVHISFEDINNADDMFKDYAFESGQPNATVFVKNESDENRALKISLRNGKKILVNIPFDFESNAKYRLTYRIKGDAKVIENANTGIFLGKSTGKTTDETAVVANIKDYTVGDRLSRIYDSSDGNSVALPTKWTNKTVIFTTGNASSVDCLSFVLSQSIIGYHDIYIDDIVIDRIYDISFVTDDTDITIDTVSNSIGSVYEKDVLKYPGYDVDKVYTDSNFKNEYSGNDFTVSNKNTTYYVKYKKSDTEKETFKFSSQKDILANNNKGLSIVEDPIDRSNKVLSHTGSSFAMISMPYKLKEGKTYNVTFKYRSNGEMVRVNLALAAGSDDKSKIAKTFYSEKTSTTQEETRQYNIFGSDNDKFSPYTTNPSLSDGWITKTISFTANDTIDGTYKYLALTAQIPEIRDGNIDSTYIYFDDISIEETNAVINFSATYNKVDIAVSPMYVNKGEKVTLPTELINPFVLEGWYYDKEYKKPVGKTLKVDDKNITLYAKVSEQKITTIDFEELSDVQFSYSKWLNGAAAITKDPDDINNHVYKAKTNAWTYSDARLNYQLMPERVYKITLRYKAEGVGSSISKVKSSFAATRIPEPENGYGLYAKANREVWHEDALSTFVMETSYPLEWTEQTFLMGTGTNGPAITDTVKYLTLLCLDQQTDDMCFLFDDIVIEDLGDYDTKFFPRVYYSGDWTIPDVDISQYNDWNSWTLSDLDIDNSTENNDDFWYDNDDGNVEETPEDEETSSKKKLVKRRKKVVVTNSGSMLWLIIVIVASVLVVATGAILFIVIRKKRKTKN